MAHNAPEGLAAAEKRGHELFDFDVRYIGWFAVGLVILLIATAGMAFFMLGGWRISNAVTARQSTAGSVTGPFATLQDTPQQDLRDYRRSKAAELEGYHWVDRSSGIVRIPIERAMQLVAAEAGTSAAASPAVSAANPASNPAATRPPDTRRRAP
jgi:hypothetical protein